VCSLEEFRFLLRMLHDLDPSDIDRGLAHSTPLTGDQWIAFKKRPAKFLLDAEPYIAAAIWKAIEARISQEESMKGFTPGPFAMKEGS
jgi:hypothetical protein